MTRTVRDAALLLGALTGVDDQDPATLASSDKAHTDYTPFLQEEGLKDARIGVLRNYFGFHEGVDAVAEQALEAMEAQGAVLVDVELATKGQFDESEYEVLLYELKHDLNAYLANLASDFPHSLEEVIGFNEKNSDQVMPFFAQEHFVKAQAKGPLTDAAYQKSLALNQRLTREQGIDALLKEHNLSALVAPSNGPAWTTDLLNGDRYLGSSSSPAAVAGYPNLSVPAGYVHGLPVGISFFSTAYQEPTLLKLAYAFEQATKVRKPPQFLATAGLEP